jgi:hypothetical protein
MIVNAVVTHERSRIWRDYAGDVSPRRCTQFLGGQNSTVKMNRDGFKNPQTLKNLYLPEQEFSPAFPIPSLQTCKPLLWLLCKVILGAIGKVMIALRFF